jgi:hypothetical protein
MEAILSMLGDKVNSLTLSISLVRGSPFCAALPALAEGPLEPEGI